MGNPAITFSMEKRIIDHVSYSQTYREPLMEEVMIRSSYVKFEYLIGFFIIAVHGQPASNIWLDSVQTQRSILQYLDIFRITKSFS